MDDRLEHRCSHSTARYEIAGALTATRKLQIWFVLQPPRWRSIFVNVMPLIVSDGSKHGTGSYHFVEF